jgi:hydrogenase expression/formation protein HypD
VSLALVPEAQVGDYVIVHVGHAIGVLDPDEAERTLALFAQMAEPPHDEIRRRIPRRRVARKHRRAHRGRSRSPAGATAFMEFCGGHTHAISRYGVAELLPPNVRMIHGPGCPVCVLPIGRIDQAIGLALERGAIVATYGDTMRVPASDGLSPDEGQGARRRHPHGLFGRRRAGAGARNPAREVVFFAIGFETTTPPTALVRAARREGLRNFSVLCCHVLTPARHHAHPAGAEPCASTARCRSTASSARRMSAS